MNRQTATKDTLILHHRNLHSVDPRLLREVVELLNTTGTPAWRIRAELQWVHELVTCRDTAGKLRAVFGFFFRNVYAQNQPVDARLIHVVFAHCDPTWSGGERAQDQLVATIHEREAAWRPEVQIFWSGPQGLSESPHAESPSAVAAAARQLLETQRHLNDRAQGAQVSSARSPRGAQNPAIYRGITSARRPPKESAIGRVVGSLIGLGRS